MQAGEKGIGIRQNPVLSIIIITKDTEELLKDLLSSIKKDKSLEPFLKEVIVVDNASADRTADMVKKEFPGLLYIKNEKNEGFAAAVNKGLSRAAGEYMLFLNSDTLLVEGETKKMLNLMKENPDIGICGPQLVYPDMRPQRSFAYVPSLVFEIFPRSLIEFLSPEAISARPSASQDLPTILNVPSLIGAAVLIRRNVLEYLGGFDERFFFFLEETDLCLRTRTMMYGKEGKTYRVVFYSHAKVIHLQGKTVARNWVQGRIEYNISLYKFIRKHHTFIYYTAFKTTRFIKCFIFLVVFSTLPFFPVKDKLKMSYTYYTKLFLWHIKGCPDNAGLRS
ncbi:MAG: glycosyltransferase family 2 protein [Proteobacteria bacterium]|nr:glycosyltransferase family 2 protein [Pseudomonadota bacterium]